MAASNTTTMTMRELDKFKVIQAVVGASLPYQRYDRLSEIDQGAVVEHKRLSHVMQ